ncbi:MAG TPA: hypothetical protein VN832_14070 [Stellaceae bacterium]|nr:hypothetical protein [Stellaceae bacterium]
MNAGGNKRRFGWTRAILIGAALIGLSGCVYAPAPYGYGGGYYPGYSYYGPAYYGPSYYGPEIGIYGGGGRRYWR